MSMSYYIVLPIASQIPAAIACSSRRRRAVGVFFALVTLIILLGRTRKSRRTGKIFPMDTKVSSIGIKIGVQRRFKILLRLIHCSRHKAQEKNFWPMRRQKKTCAGLAKGWKEPHLFGH